jgi:hypothetical protein
MAFLDDFACYKNVSATVKRITTVDNTATGEQDETITEIGTFTCIFWTGSQAESVVSEKIRSIVSAVAVFDVGTDINTRDTVTINSKEYNVIYTDDVGLQGDALVVPLQEID